MRRPENGFRELPSLLRDGLLSRRYCRRTPDPSLPEEFRLQLASVEWPRLHCLLYTVVVGKSSPKIRSGKHHVEIQVRFDRPIW